MGSKKKRMKPNCTFGDGESRRPLWSQNVKTNAAVAVDIWVVDSCGKSNLKTDKGGRNVGGTKGGDGGRRRRWERQQEIEWCEAEACFSRQEALDVHRCYACRLFVWRSCLPLAVWRGSLWGSVWSRRKPRSGKDCHSNAGREKLDHLIATQVQRGHISYLKHHEVHEREQIISKYILSQSV